MLFITDDNYSSKEISLITCLYEYKPKMAF